MSWIILQSSIIVELIGFIILANFSRITSWSRMGTGIAMQKFTSAPTTKPVDKSKNCLNIINIIIWVMHQTFGPLLGILVMEWQVITWWIIVWNSYLSYVNSWHTYVLSQIMIASIVQCMEVFLIYCFLKNGHRFL